MVPLKGIKFREDPCILSGEICYSLCWSGELVHFSLNTFVQVGGVDTQSDTVCVFLWCDDDGCALLHRDGDWCNDNQPL